MNFATLPPGSAGPFRGRARAALLAIALVFALPGCSDLHEDEPLLAEYANPVQTSPGETLEPFELAPGFTAKPRAKYEMVAHVMSVERYRLEAFADVVPYDFALAWGPTASADNLTRISVRQSGRWFYWRVKDPKQLPASPIRELQDHMANVHIVPANKEILEAVHRVKPGMSLRAKGYLVDISSESRGSRITSVTRTDVGAGACEIFFIEEIEVISERPAG